MSDETVIKDVFGNDVDIENDPLSSETTGKKPRKTRETKKSKTDNIDKKDISMLFKYMYNIFARWSNSNVEFDQGDFEKESEILAQAGNKSETVKQYAGWIWLLLVIPMLFEKYVFVRKNIVKDENIVESSNPT